MHLGVESWVINDRHGATTENAKRYIDFAAANNIEGVMFEGGTPVGKIGEALRTLIIRVRMLTLI